MSDYSFWVVYYVCNIFSYTYVDLLVLAPISNCSLHSNGSFTADSYIACRAFAVILPCLALIHTCHAAPLLRQCRVLRESPRGNRKYPNCQSNSMIHRLFCSVLLPLFTVVGMDRCEEDCYASDNNFRGTPHDSRKQPKAGRQPACSLSKAVVCRGLDKQGMVRAWHGRDRASVNQTRPHCVNQMGKTHSKLLEAQHDGGTAWARHAMCESAFKLSHLGL